MSGEERSNDAPMADGGRWPRTAPRLRRALWTVRLADAADGDHGGEREEEAPRAEDLAEGRAERGGEARVERDDGGDGGEGHERRHEERADEQRGDGDD